MKKLLICGIMAISSHAFAQSSVSLTYGALQDNPVPVDKHVVGLRVATKVAKSVDADFGISTTTAKESNSIVNRYEAGATYTHDRISIFTPTLRVGLGVKQASGKDEFTYYAVEPAVSFSTPINNLTARVGYRFRNGFSSNANDDSETSRYSLSYKLSEKDRISVGYDIQRGDGANSQKYLQYTRSF